MVSFSVLQNKQVRRSFFSVLFMPYNKSFIDQASSVKMAGYWPRSQKLKQKFSFAEIIFWQGKKMFCVFSVYMEPEKTSTRMKTKKTKMLMSLKRKFCDKNRQAQKFVLNFKILILILNLNLKCNQSNDFIFCIYPIRI